MSKRFDKIALPIFVFIILAAMAFFLTNSVVSSARANTHTDISTGISNASYEKMSTAGAEFLKIRSMATNGLNSMDPTNPLVVIGYLSTEKRTGIAGGLLGYIADPLLRVNDANNETTYSVEDVQKYTSTTNGGALGYQAYGQLLSYLGLDEVSINGQSSSDGYRQIVGWLYKFLYLGSILLNVFFNLVFTILGYANPFRLFSSTKIVGGGNSGIDAGLSNGIVDGAVNVSVANSMSNGPANNVLSSLNDGVGALQDFIASFYGTLKSLSLFVILPLTLAITLFVLLVWRKGQGVVKTFKDYLIKLVFVSIGLPLMFACYSTAIDLMGEFTVADNAVGTRVIASTFCDFEGWAKRNLGATYMGVNSTVEYTMLTNDLSSTGGGLTAAHSRYICSNINSHVHTAPSFSFNMPAHGSATSQIMTAYDAELLNTTNATSVYSDVNYISVIMDLLDRYSKGIKYTAADYSSYRNSSRPPVGYGMYGYSLDSPIPTDDHRILSAVSVGPEGFDPNKAVAFAQVNGSSAVRVDTSQIVNLVTKRFAKESTPSSIWNDGDFDCASVIRNGYSSYDYGSVEFNFTSNISNGRDTLSTMSMYNYLKSHFEAGKITVYSADESTSSATKCAHYSVTAVGSGLLRIIYILDGLVLLAAVVVIGYFYGLSMLISNFKAIFKMIPSVITGMLGSKTGIASVVILTAAMIIEIIGTCLVYCIATELLYVIYLIVEMPIGAFLDILFNRFSSHGSFFNNIIPVLLGVLSIVIIWMLICKALKYRFAIVHAATEATAAMVNKFLGTSVSSPNLSAPSANLAGKAISAASTAAGLGMAASAMDKTGELEGYKNSFANALGISPKPDGASTATGGDTGSSSVRDGTVTENNPHGVKTSLNSGVGGQTADAFVSANQGASDNTGKSDNEGVNLNKTTEEKADVNNNITADGDSGSNNSAENYIIQNKEAFLSALNESNTEAGSTADVKQVLAEDGSDGNIKLDAIDKPDSGDNNNSSNSQTAEAKIMSGTSDTTATVTASGSSGTGSSGNNSAMTMTMSDGSTTSGYRMINSETGDNYTAADQKNGASYSIVDSAGKAYVDSTGNSYANMSSATAMPLDNGQMSVMNPASGAMMIISESTVQSGGQSGGQSANPVVVPIVTPGGGSTNVVNNTTTGGAANVANSAVYNVTGGTQQGDQYTVTNNQAGQSTSPADVNVNTVGAMPTAPMGGSSGGYSAPISTDTHYTSGPVNNTTNVNVTVDNDLNVGGNGASFTSDTGSSGNTYVTQQVNQKPETKDKKEGSDNGELGSESGLNNLISGAVGSIGKIAGAVASDVATRSRSNKKPPKQPK